MSMPPFRKALGGSGEAPPPLLFLRDASKNDSGQSREEENPGPFFSTDFQLLHLKT